MQQSSAVFTGKQFADPKPVPERAPQVAVEIDVLTKDIAFQSETIQQLIERLRPALSLAPQEEIGSKNGNEPTCPLAAEIQNLGFAVRNNTEVLLGILRRLEV